MIKIAFMLGGAVCVCITLITLTIVSILNEKHKD